MRLTTGLLFIVGAAVSSVMALKEAPTELQVGKAKISRKKLSKRFTYSQLL